MAIKMINSIFFDECYLWNDVKFDSYFNNPNN